jgi:hypothetical protein
MPKVLTANRLLPGEVVYWNSASGWVGELAEAEILADATAEAALSAAAEWVTRREIVAPYLFDVRVEGGRVVPVKVRELIRSRGPTVRQDLGKQAH